MQLNHAGRGLRSALVLILCGLFFVLAMGITLLASGVYRDTVKISDQSFTHRTVLSYLINQIRRSDTAEGVSVGSFGGADALVLREGDYVTLLYCADGQLRELYTEPGSGLTPQDGVAILPLADLSITATPEGIAITASDENGKTYSALYLPRCGFEGIGEVVV